MLRWRHVEISGGFLLVAALLFYLDTENLLFWAAAACALHELGHGLAIRCLGGRVALLRLTCVGAELKLSARYPMGYGRQLLAALGGPAANLLCAGAAVHMAGGGPICLPDSIWRLPALICCRRPRWTAGGACGACWRCWKRKRRRNGSWPRPRLQYPWP